MDELDVYEAAKELYVSAGAVTPADVAAHLRTDDVERVGAALDALVARELLARAEGNPSATYRPARGHEDVDV